MLETEVKPMLYNEKGNREILFPAKELGLPEIYHVPWKGREASVYVYRYEDITIWGITAAIIYEISAIIINGGDTLKEKVIIGCDHSAFELKEKIKKFLAESGYGVSDAGVCNEERADYPDIAEKACSEFLNGGYAFGILCCGTGIGISIAANKIKRDQMCAPS